MRWLPLNSKILKPNADFFTKTTNTRTVFFLKSHLTKIFNRYATRTAIPYRIVCSFTDSNATYTVYVHDNHLARTLDPINTKLLTHWLQQFPSFSTPSASSSTRRIRILRRFRPATTADSAVFSEVYLAYLNPDPSRVTIPDPLSLLLGFSTTDGHLPKHLRSHCNGFAQTLYSHHSRLHHAIRLQLDSD